MGASNEELLNCIRSYQRSVDKYESLGNTHKLMSIIEKLKRLPIATSHLEQTGIGRTVNGLRKLGGEVGDAAKGLVARWKEMVLQEEEKVKEDAVDEIAKEACVETENDNDCYEEKGNSCRGEEEEEDNQYLEKQSSSSHRSSDTERKSSEKYEKDTNKYSTNNGSGSSHQKKDKHQDMDSSSKKRRKSNSSTDEHSSKRHHDSSGFESEEGVYEEKQKSTSKRNKESESSENEKEEDRKHKSKKSRHSKDSSDSEDSYKKHKSSRSSRDSSSSKSKSREKTEIKKRDYDSSSDRETDKSNSKHRSHSKSKRESDCEEDKSSSKHKSKKTNESSSDNEEAKHKSKHESKSRHDKDSSKSRESKSHSSHSDKHERKDKKEVKRDESKEKHSHKKGESRNHEDKPKKSKDEKETSKKQKSSSSGRQEESSKPSSSSSKHKSSSEKKKDKVKLPKPVNTEKIMNGIDSGSGASFAEALGMCGPMVSKSSSTSSSSKKKSSSLPSYEKPRSSSSYVRPEKTELVEEEDIVPTLLKEQPREPININISSLLPDITPNYRPVGFPVDSLPKRVVSQDEALSQVISNKGMRTKVYSGNKSFGKVETLFDLCVRILQDNIDALEYTGGVPFLILKPVLERATPDQLFNMEHHNPYLIEDTDELWQLHCQKEFRNKKREELESWREMYMRCLNEREARLNAITANIKQSQDKSTPIRTTKLAYIDSVVKPPRNIARKQAKNGITFDKKPAQTPASRVAALASHVETGKVAVPNPGSRAERSSSSTAAAIKPKKAPLMAKTLSFLKNRFRR